MAPLERWDSHRAVALALADEVTPLAIGRPRARLRRWIRNLVQTAA